MTGKFAMVGDNAYCGICNRRCRINADPQLKRVVITHDPVPSLPKDQKQCTQVGQYEYPTVDLQKIEA